MTLKDVAVKGSGLFERWLGFKTHKQTKKCKNINKKEEHGRSDSASAAMLYIVQHFRILEK